MKILAGLIRLFEASSASDRAICEAYTHDDQLQLKANDLGHCAVYEKELQRLWPINEEIGIAATAIRIGLKAISRFE
jgi:hypothetical protein